MCKKRFPSCNASRDHHSNAPQFDVQLRWVEEERLFTQTSRGALLAVAVSERDHASGSPDASVTLVEYGDFECSLRYLQELWIEQW